jgi:hypothetical protein
MSVRMRAASMLGLSVALTLCIAVAAHANTLCKVGVIDNQGRTIIPCEYRSITYSGDGFFLEKFDPSNPLHRTDKWHRVDNSGKLLRQDVPTSEVVRQPVQNADDLGGYKVISVTDRGAKKGLLNSKSEVLLPTEFTEITHLFDGVFAIRKIGEHQASIFSADGKPAISLPIGTIGVARLGNDKFICRSATADPELQNYICINRNGQTLFSGSSHGVLTSPLGVVQLWRHPAGKCIKWQLINDSGNVIQPYQSSHFVPVSRDRILKFQPVDHFSPGWWKNPYTTPNDLERTDNFANFLRDYDLIGMKKSKLEELLGPSEGNPRVPFNSYGISCGDCGNSSVSLEIEFANDVVARWRLNGETNVMWGWVSKNVVFEPEAREKILTPKVPGGGS